MYVKKCLSISFFIIASGNSSLCKSFINLFNFRFCVVHLNNFDKILKQGIIFVIEIFKMSDNNCSRFRCNS